ncbi:hypothetical protein BHL62_02960 [Xanthomonas oryzae pv. oryzae]|nr:hypothetical protein BHL62_02960 [Xanthomonas oryzae pv. oryzae]
MSALFENWESQFLQMGMYVLLTVKLRQVGAAASRPLDPAEETTEIKPVSNRRSRGVRRMIRKSRLRSRSVAARTSSGQSMTCLTKTAT